MPPATIIISILVLPASMLFSNSSFNTDAGRSMTSPAAILLAKSGANFLICLCATTIPPYSLQYRSRQLHLIFARF